MLQVSEDDRDARCFVKAKRRGQKTFTVVEQDQTAVPTIAHWIYLNIRTAPPEKLRDALESCIEMRDYSETKAAD